MSQIFHPSTNTISRVTIFGGAGFIVVLVVALAAINESPYITEVGVARSQPVPFSHKHHVGDDGIDCRYCHTSVEESSFAGIPPTKTCMNCHTQIWSDSPMLEPVRESFRTGKSIQWTRVHNLPGFVYFDHSIHMHKGVGCSTCHGRVDRCRSRGAKTRSIWSGASNVTAIRSGTCGRASTCSTWITNRRPIRSRLGEKLVKEYRIRKLTSCSTCHR